MHCPAWHDVADLGSDFRNFESGNEAHQIMRVRTDIAHHERWATAHWIKSPRGGRIGLAFICLAPLNIFHLNKSDCAKLSILNHRFRLSHHWITRVIVREAKDQTGLLYFFMQSFGFFECVGHGLIADDIEAAFQCQYGIFIMTIVWGHDSDHVCAIFACRFPIQHF